VRDPDDFIAESEREGDLGRARKERADTHAKIISVKSSIMLLENLHEKSR
jgi:hypothetical protein